MHLMNNSVDYYLLCYKLIVLSEIPKWKHVNTIPGLLEKSFKLNTRLLYFLFSKMMLKIYYN